MQKRFSLSSLCLPMTILLCSTPRAIGEGSSVLDATGPEVLDAYLARADPTYSWQVVRSAENAQGQFFVIDLTSLSWLTAEEVNRTKWHHWMVVTKPKKLQHSTAILILSGGANEEPAPDLPSKRARRVSEKLGAVVVELQQVPNEPLMFHEDGKRRYEDDLIAYAGDQFVKTNDLDWIVRMPMVKSAVKAMDTVQELARREFPRGPEIEDFIVVGASKRGWTSWLVAGADPRVKAVVPLVIDCLNVAQSMPHHVAAYGFWAPAIGDYERHGLLSRLEQPQYRRLLEIDDPYFHRQRVTMPKYIVNSAGDQFFLPDSSQFYFDDLIGEKHLRYVPNTDHSLDGSDAEESIASFCHSILQEEERPQYEWGFAPDGSIEVTCETNPTAVRLWQASNSDARDFRLETIGPAYHSKELSPITPGEYRALAPKVERGWTAYFVELEFPTALGPSMKFTTGVRVTPDVLPHHNLIETKTFSP